MRGVDLEHSNRQLIRDIEIGNCTTIESRELGIEHPVRSAVHKRVVQAQYSHCVFEDNGSIATWVRL